MKNDRHEDELEPRLREAARDYHRPPSSPEPALREEMWAAIQEGRRARRRRRTVVWAGLAWAAGVAAVLAVGVAIGRWSAVPIPDGAVATAPDQPVAYRLAATQYLSRTEALLTGFRAHSRGGSGGGEPDAQFARTARDLLAITRLMLDSPAADDPLLKPLLEDLELVLAQITQLPPPPRTRLGGSAVDHPGTRTTKPADPPPLGDSRRPGHGHPRRAVIC